MSVPPLGLLLDVDGPVASPDSRTVAPELLADLGSLVRAGIPVVLNTGRSMDFVSDRVLQPLVDAGLPDGARLHTVCEKGGVWATVEVGGIGAVHVDATLAVPEVCHAVLAELMGDVLPRAGSDRDGGGRTGYGDAMFVDTTKRTMATVEARTDVDPGYYAQRQREFDADLVARLCAAGLGVRLHDRCFPDGDGETPWRIDPSVIATDVESSRAGKALGARRALELVGADGALPAAWHTVGDSRTDYAMADELHELGADVVHVDVSPQAPLSRVYPVRTVPGATYAAAGGAHLRQLAARLC